uniref:Protein kinase domain-containing protein n=1 Tax=Musa acuminata subsp. malaccensis TaxID=214687 RepID=A0A804HQ78_MUSAM|nr:PREDICTED: putative wall-associated receptor kinase-like 16 [Musa acuminata subsp. malaccensis]
MGSTLPLFAFQLLLLLTLLQAATTAAASAPPSPNVVSPRCNETCGGISIPYPFGIGDGCFREGFEVTCEVGNGSATPRAFLVGRERNITVEEIILPQGQARILNYVSWDCFNSTNDWVAGRRPTLDLGDKPFWVSSTKNRFTTMGCNVIGIVIGGDNYSLGTGCASFCFGGANITSGSCSGTGCCQTTIPEKLENFTTGMAYFINVSSSYRDYIPCTFTFVADQDGFAFDESYLRNYNFYDKYKDGVPLVLDWVAGRQTCAEAKRNPSSYACRSTNSKCFDSTSLDGYICNCSTGFHGNPYLQDGCKDIDECSLPTQYPCHGTCSNTAGNYRCSCPKGHSSKDPKSEPCVQDHGIPTSTKIVIGSCVGLVSFITCIFCVILTFQRRKLLREKDKFFQQNGGLRLYEEIRSKQIDTVKIYTKEDIEKATDNFDKSRELGRGGHGTVYKGYLDDGREVAIKRSKVVTEDQSEEFVREMIILSQINHKNIVRLLGCCLEVEIPMLVYEFIPNGTLFEFIHDNDGKLIPLTIRLRIARESAEALAYLHSSASPPIIHGDVKSLNILLDHNYVPKVSDFGASRMMSLDETQFITMVQGTLGYLDPEYLLVRQLTAKSDVYSFGVVLMELITRIKAIYYDGSSQGKCLASSFIEAMKDSRLEEILDDQIMGKENMDVIQEIAELAKECLNMNGDERPSMRELAEKLHMLEGFLQVSSTHHAAEECEALLGESSMSSTLDSVGYHSLENKLGFDVKAGR